MINREIPDDLTHASFFFIDIVGLSNPILSTETQKTKISVLNESIYDCHEFSSTAKENLFVLPTGDGMLIGFKENLEKPIKLAIELHEKLLRHNLDVPNTEKILVRIGCNVGHIFVVKDIFGNTNLWGPGAILARRVMDLGDDGHILLTSNMADDLIDISEKYREILHLIHNYTIKHNEEILVYSAYSSGFGNKNSPKKIFDLIKSNNLKETENRIICNKVIFNLKIDTKITNLVKHERIYYFENTTTEPVYQFSMNIITNKEHMIDDLKIKIFDDHNYELKITKINAISSFSKQITTKLMTPLPVNSSSLIRLTYETSESEKIFEDIFLTDSDHFELNYYSEDSMNKVPRLYHINCANYTKNQIEHSEPVLKDPKNKMQWKKENRINVSDMIRLEW